MAEAAGSFQATSQASLHRTVFSRPATGLGQRTKALRASLRQAGMSDEGGALVFKG
jgi:hypothetical protein